MTFEPDYRHVVDCARNRRPRRMPLYEHNVNTPMMAKVLGCPVELLGNEPEELDRYYALVCRFWKEMTYDTVSFECCACGSMGVTGALAGGKGEIQTRSDFEQLDLDAAISRYWERFDSHYAAMARVMPAGMKAVGGVGNGVLEVVQNLVGYEYLCMMQYDDPDLFADLFESTGSLLVRLWKQMLERHGDLFAVCRFGDDLGFKSAPLLAPQTIAEHIVPQYKRVIDVIHAAGKPFLLHSCGNIFEIMEDLVGAGIDAKHSNEDAIAPMDEWVERYGDRIGFFGGIDVDFICRSSPAEIRARTIEEGTRLREMAQGFALGSGNSIPEWIPLENYLAMIEGASEVRSQTER